MNHNLPQFINHNLWSPFVGSKANSSGLRKNSVIAKQSQLDEPWCDVQALLLYKTWMHWWVQVISLTPQDLWQHLVISENIWCHFVIYDSAWWHLMTHGDTWGHSLTLFDIRILRMTPSDTLWLFWWHSIIFDSTWSVAITNWKSTMAKVLCSIMQYYAVSCSIMQYFG